MAIKLRFTNSHGRLQESERYIYINDEIVKNNYQNLISRKCINILLIYCSIVLTLILNFDHCKPQPSPPNFSVSKMSYF